VRAELQTSERGATQRTGALLLERGLRSARFLIEEVASGAQPYLPSSAIYCDAGWPL